MNSILRPIVSGISQGILGGGSAFNPLVFHAITFDPVTTEILGVKTGTGDLTEGNTSTRYTRDFEDIHRSFISTVPAYQGGRVVENLVLQSEDLDTTWSQLNVTVTTGQTDPDGGSTAFRVKATASGTGTMIRQTNVTDTDEISAASWWVKRITGTGVIKMYTGDGTSRPAITAIVTTSWQRIATGLGSGTAAGRCGILLETENDEVDLWHPQMEHVSGQSNQAPAEYVATTTAAVQKVFASTNNNTVASNVVTEVAPTPFSAANLPWLVALSATTNSQIRSNDLADVEWTASNMTVGDQDETGITGAASTACTLTATAANATVLANAITAGSATQASTWFIKRKTGTGDIDLTVDGGSTWQTVVTTASFVQFSVDQAAVTNPQIGIRVVVDTDAVIVGNGECLLATTKGLIRTSTPLFTVAATTTVNASDDSFDDADHIAAQGGYFVEWQPQYATAEVSGDIEIISLNNSAGLLYYDATNSQLEATDGTNTAVVAMTIVAGTTYKIWVAYGGTSLQVGFDATTGTAGTFDGAFATGTKIELVTPSIATNYVRNLRHYNLPFAAAVSKLQSLAA